MVAEKTSEAFLSEDKMETKKDMKTTEIVKKHQYGIICFFSGFIMGVILSVIIAYSLPSSCQNAGICALKFLVSVINFGVDVLKF